MGRWTVQSLIDGGMDIHAYCHNSRCNHNAGMDLSALRDKLGPDAPAMSDDLIPRLRCSRCGGRDVGLIYSPADTKGMVPDSNSNGRGWWK